MKIALLGDVALIGKYDVSNINVFNRLKTIKSYLSSFDYVICNLEAPLTNKNKTLVCKSMHLRSDARNVEILKYLGINAVNLANNHICDFGKDGLLDTIKILESSGIEWFGVNGKTVHITNNNSNVCLSGFCSYSTNGTGYATHKHDKGINLLTYSNIQKQIETDTSNNEYSLINLHWGTENSRLPDVTSLAITERLFEIKEDIVICGHHPHVLQGTKPIKGGFVAYSLGNFLFDDCVSLNGLIKVEQQDINKQGLLLELSFADNQLINNDIVGIRDDDDQGIVLFDVTETIAGINDDIAFLSKTEYENKRRTERAEVNLERMGKRDIKWLISHLNYYSIGARLSMYYRRHKYNKVLKEFGI